MIYICSKNTYIYNLYKYFFIHFQYFITDIHFKICFKIAIRMVWKFIYIPFLPSFQAYLLMFVYWTYLFQSKEIILHHFLYFFCLSYSRRHPTVAIFQKKHCSVSKLLLNVSCKFELDGFYIFLLFNNFYLFFVI